MSSNNVERALWEINVNPESRRRFAEDAARFLGRYRLTQDECNMIRQFDVRGLTDHGVSPLLVMAFWMELQGGGRDLDEYLKRMSAAPSHAEVRGATQPPTGTANG